MKIGFRRRKEWKKICEKCGHNHVNLIGDAGINKDEMMFELMNECIFCDCEKFEDLK